jgi:phosphoserine phosphatase
VASVVLLRHGESVAITEGRFQGRQDSPLSPLGERQAALAAMRLADPGRSPALPIADRPPLEIVHSPLRRAARTAELYADEIGRRGGHAATLVADEGFAEIAQGSWEGRLREEIERDDAALLSEWRHEPLRSNAPGGERVLDAARRVHAALIGVIDRLVAESALETAVSAPPGPAAWSRVPGYGGSAAPEAPWTLIVGHDGVFKVTLLTLLGLPLDAFWSFPFALCGITVVELREGRARLRAHNLIDHLAPLADEERAEAEAASREATGAL